MIKPIKGKGYGTYTEKELEHALKELVQRNYLKKTKKGYVDSDKVKSLLKKGKTRKQIANILNKAFDERKVNVRKQT